MKIYDNESPEYLGNGHYKIEGHEFMSIWAFKKKHGIEPNTTVSNGPEGKELCAKTKSFHHSKPDASNFDSVFIYHLNELEKHYGI